MHRSKEPARKLAKFAKQAKPVEKNAMPESVVRRDENGNLVEEFPPAEYEGPYRLPKAASAATDWSKCPSELRGLEAHKADTDQKQWETAWNALAKDENPAPLADMINGNAEIPRWVRVGLARLLHPEIDAPLASKDSDRLVFHRSDAVKGKMATNEDHIAHGLAVLDARSVDKDKSYETAVAEIAERTGKSESYIGHCVSLARELPDFYKRTARKL